MGYDNEWGESDLAMEIWRREGARAEREREVGVSEAWSKNVLVEPLLLDLFIVCLLIAYACANGSMGS